MPRLGPFNSTVWLRSTVSLFCPPVQCLTQLPMRWDVEVRVWAAQVVWSSLTWTWPYRLALLCRGIPEASWRAGCPGLMKRWRSEVLEWTAAAASCGHEQRPLSHCGFRDRPSAPTLPESLTHGLTDAEHHLIAVNSLPCLCSDLFLRSSSGA